jgi:RNA polymerase sigma-70 factor, ECF subfamily
MTHGIGHARTPHQPARSDGRSAAPGGPRGSASERQMVQALRSGDESTFARLVEHYAPTMLGVASAYVPTRELAEDVVQDTWLALLTGLDGFGARSRLHTWLFRVLINIARTRGARERRCTPFASLTDPAYDDPEHAITSGRVLWSGTGSPGWADSPELRTLSAETLRCARQAMTRLPRRQRIVVTLRDILGSTPDEVCAALGISAANQRVLLHRARASIRRAVALHGSARARAVPRPEPERPRGSRQ